ESVQRPAELVDFALCALAIPPVAFLQLARQVLAVAGGNVEHIVCQVAPLGLRLAFELRPLAGNDVVVHRDSPCCVGDADSIATSTFTARGRGVTRDFKTLNASCRSGVRTKKGPAWPALFPSATSAGLALLQRG